jgi:hypothetical protein
MAAAIAALATLGAAAPLDDVGRLQGVYRRAFANQMADGQPYRSVDEIRIERRGPAAAYVAVHLEFRNGHTCDIDGLTLYANGALTMTADPRTSPGEVCRFALTALPDVLKISAEGEGCNAYCGMRGRLDGAQLPRAVRRPLPRRRDRR